MGRTSIRVRINTELKKRFKTLCDQKKVSMSGEITRLFELVVQTKEYKPTLHNLPDFGVLDDLLQMDIKEDLLNKADEVFESLGITKSSAVTLHIRECVATEHLLLEKE